jgi:serine/threonine protein kinase
MHSPVPFAGAATAHDDHTEPAARCSVLDTAPPLGSGPHDSRLFVFVRRAVRDGEPRRLPCEPLTIHDADGRELTAITGDNAEIDHGAGYVAYACRATPGTYRLRAVRSQRDAAIVVPAGRAAQVFLADTGALRLAELRLALVPVGARFNPASRIWAAMESVIAALRVPDRPLPPAARAMLPDAIDDDLCFGIAAAHVLWRSGDRAGLGAVMRSLARYREIPDVAILDSIEGSSASHERRRRSPADLSDTPPLLRASVTLAMTRPELDPGTLSAYSAFAHAARTAVHDSVWCLWSTRTWDERWIEPAVERLREPDRARDATAIARSLALATETVEQAIEALDASAPSVLGNRLHATELEVPGYVLDSLLGRGARSAVYRARRQGDGRAVALKIVPVPGGADGCARAHRELDRCPATEHPALLAATARGTLPGCTGIWLEMELCHGSVLDRLSEDNAPLTPLEAHRLMLDALAVLAHLHERGIAHGDLTPSNLLLRGDGSVAIAGLDLGVRRALGAGPHRQADAPRFAPPELLRDEPVAPTSDVWAMAAIYYFLVTLEYPRDEYADQSQLEAALYNPIVSLGRRRPDLPPALVQPIDAALSPTGEVRPRDAAALRQLLGAILVTAPAALSADDPSGQGVETPPGDRAIADRSKPGPQSAMLGRAGTRRQDRGRVRALLAGTPTVRGRVSIAMATLAVAIIGLLIGSITRSSSRWRERDPRSGDRAVAESAALNEAWLLRHRDPAAASNQLDALASSSGERPGSLLLRSFLAADRSDLATAERELERAERLAPDASWTWSIEQAHAELCELRGGEDGDPHAELHYRRAIAAVAALRPTARAPQPHRASLRGPYEGLIALLARHARWNDVLAVALQLGHAFPDGRNDEAPPSVSEVVSAWRARDLVLSIAPARRQIGSGRERAYRIRIAGGQVSGEDIGDASSAVQLATTLFENPADRDAARALGARMIPPGPETSALHVLTIGALSRAPLAALRDATGSLIITHRPLTRVLTLQASGLPPARSERAVIIGDPLGNLPGAAAEGAVVAQAAGPSARVAGASTSAAATRSLLWTARDADLLHVAAPIFALGGSRALQLADGTVAPGDILQHGVAPRIAVLTGNSSASTDDDGRGSFAAALLEAGTEIVIATDRSVEDTAALAVMKAFYAQPDWRTEPARALARVQVAAEASSTARADSVSRAGAWAAFGVLGRPAVLPAAPPDLSRRAAP